MAANYKVNLVMGVSVGSSRRTVSSELANLEKIAPNLESSSIKVVKALYEALRGDDIDSVQRLLALDLEWWFHGPAYPPAFNAIADRPPALHRLQPHTSINTIGSTVLAEGCDPDFSVT
ncbi:hypothetical protein Scep_008579 [Stephania cephalantha]|uniref:Uncharacterized protein n=1 Tax=Stephania cephalantha TaxID=152367 RepID=A0AAP0KEK7_9MAGN